MKAVRHEVRPVAPRGPPGRSGWPRLHNHPQTSMGGGGSEPRGCQGALGAYGSIQHSRPRPQTAPPRAPHPAWARGAGVRSRYGLSWPSPADGYKTMTRCLRGWPCIGVLSRLQINPVQRGCCAKKHAAPCTTIRKTPLHVPDMGPHSRQGLSNIIDAPTSPKGVACSPLSETTCLPYEPPCPTHCTEYAAYRSESIPHEVIKTKTPTQ
jgi:hypothetical protein